MASEPVTLADIKAAHDRIRPIIKRTPVFENDDFNTTYGRKFYFKADCMQKTGSFKLRGALNAVLKLKESGQEIKGLVTHSSGNHGRALSWVARRFNIPCVVVCPENVPEIKIKEIKNLGAELVRCQPSPPERMEAVMKVQEERGYHYVSTSDDYDIIAGQGTIALELLEQVPEIDAILIPASGGGIAAGICVAAKSINPDIKVFIVEPEGKDLERCLVAGERLWPDPPGWVDTIADGIRQQQITIRAWPILLKYAEKRVLTMRDEDAIRGMQYAFRNMKIVAEPSSGIVIGAAMSRDFDKIVPESKHVAVIVGGGNVDPSLFLNNPS